jgi:hypothetical protein
VRIETDAHRRVLRRDLPLFQCDAPPSCYRYQGQGQFAIVAEAGAPRGGCGSRSIRAPWERCARDGG